MMDSNSIFERFGYEDYHPGIIVHCTICKERIRSRIVYCNICKSTIGHSECIQNECICPGCSTVINVVSTLPKNTKEPITDNDQ